MLCQLLITYTMHVCSRRVPLWLDPMRPCVLVGQSVLLVYVSYPSSHPLYQVGVHLRPRRVSGDLDSTRNDGHLKEGADWHPISHLCTVLQSLISLLTLGLRQILCEAFFVMHSFGLNLCGAWMVVLSRNEFL
jgi:hypothetical protein